MSLNKNSSEESSSDSSWTEREEFKKTFASISGQTLTLLPANNTDFGSVPYIPTGHSIPTRVGMLQGTVELQEVEIASLRSDLEDLRERVNMVLSWMELNK